MPEAGDAKVACTCQIHCNRKKNNERIAEEVGQEEIEEVGQEEVEEVGL